MTIVLPALAIIIALPLHLTAVVLPRETPASDVMQGDYVLVGEEGEETGLDDEVGYASFEGTIPGWWFEGTHVVFARGGRPVSFGGKFRRREVFHGVEMVGGIIRRPPPETGQSHL